MSFLFDKVVIFGIGQIGSSLGRDLVSLKMAREVIGVSRSASHRKTALKEKVCHRAVDLGETETLLKTLSQKDLVILATPVGKIVESLKKISRKPFVIDVGSTKESIVREAKKRKLRFVGCHPLAGTEESGVLAGQKNLFRGRICFLTPSAISSSDRKKIILFWKRLGSRIILIASIPHDRLLAAVSHLPHVLAFALVSVVSRLGKKSLSLTGTSFRDATRVAMSPTLIWKDIFLENRFAILKMIHSYEKELNRFRRMISRRNASGLLRYLKAAQKARQGLAS